MDLINKYIEEQKATCVKYDANYVEADWEMFIGLGRGFDPKQNPINGLRHPIHDQTTGWYIWSGEDFDKSDDTFFEPVHLHHLIETYPDIIKFLGLEPGWRFLVADNASYVDVWEDLSLLDAVD
ncbi:immunity protein Imm33 domain-containing protein [Aquimarina mytili]|uniref:Imm33-like domain-containing protein n=1 Tax=Aquimarina mytili TaxID=874423 RepID=A0A937DBH0_9FLAO|nr:hypothetical protein [Aquimarina mytili]MBL0685737.1 hypothetical protein [Aquimarina mytili]